MRPYETKEPQNIDREGIAEQIAAVYPSDAKNYVVPARYGGFDWEVFKNWKTPDNSTRPGRPSMAWYRVYIPTFRPPYGQDYMFVELHERHSTRFPPDVNERRPEWYYTWWPPHLHISQFSLRSSEDMPTYEAWLEWQKQGIELLKFFEAVAANAGIIFTTDD